MKPRLLDLFCGAGGAAMGYHRAGFEVVGVDIVPQPRFPFEFVQANALEYPFDNFDVIHASPPCQKWVTIASNTNPQNGQYKNLVYPIRLRFEAQDRPYVIENVPGSPLKSPLILCGTFFPSLRVLRHRHFEMNNLIEQPPLDDCENHPPVYSRDKRSPQYGKLDPETAYVSVFGNSSVRKEHAETAMGIDWMNKYELTQAIPPDYTEFIGKQLLQLL